jgi:hypothetical protein
LIGDRYYEWEGADVSFDWLIFYVLAMIDDTECELMIRAGQNAKKGGFRAAIHSLVALQRLRNKHDPKDVTEGLTE